MSAPPLHRYYMICERTPAGWPTMLGPWFHVPNIVGAAGDAAVSAFFEVPGHDKRFHVRSVICPAPGPSSFPEYLGFAPGEREWGRK